MCKSQNVCPSAENLLTVNILVLKLETGSIQNFGTQIKEEKSRVLETKHLSTDADSSTDAIGGWTKNTQKPYIFFKRKKSPKTQKLRNV